MLTGIIEEHLGYMTQVHDHQQLLASVWDHQSGVKFSYSIKISPRRATFNYIYSPTKQSALYLLALIWTLEVAWTAKLVAFEQEGDFSIAN